MLNTNGSAAVDQAPEFADWWDDELAEATSAASAQAARFIELCSNGPPSAAELVAISDQVLDSISRLRGAAFVVARAASESEG